MLSKMTPSHTSNSLCCLGTILGAGVLFIRFGKRVFPQLVKEHNRLSLRSTLISSSHLHVSLPIGFFPSRFLAETLNTFLISLFVCLSCELHAPHISFLCLSVSRANYMLRTSHFFVCLSLVRTTCSAHLIFLDFIIPLTYDRK